VVIALLVYFTGQFRDLQGLQGRAERMDSVHPGEVGPQGLGVFADPVADVRSGLQRGLWQLLLQRR
jgi:hypothetical protein